MILSCVVSKPAMSIPLVTAPNTVNFASNGASRIRPLDLRLEGVANVAARLAGRRSSQEELPGVGEIDWEVIPIAQVSQHDKVVHALWRVSGKEVDQDIALGGLDRGRKGLAQVDDYGRRAIEQARACRRVQFGQWPIRGWGRRQGDRGGCRWGQLALSRFRDLD